MEGPIFCNLTLKGGMRRKREREGEKIFRILGVYGRAAAIFIFSINGIWIG